MVQNVGIILKIDKTKDEQSENKELFTYFLTSFSTKMK